MNWSTRVTKDLSGSKGERREVQLKYKMTGAWMCDFGTKNGTTAVRLRQIGFVGSWVISVHSS